MVEAAIFFPIAVLAAMAVLQLMLGLYHGACVQANLHIAVRAEAAQESGTGASEVVDAYGRDRYRADAEALLPDLARTGGRGAFAPGSVEGRAQRRYYGNRLTDPSGYESYFFGRSYVIDEEGFARAGGFELRIEN
ncbi:MAG: hypothetical protein LBR44_07230 [Clostridiales Family XIII bacterium]|jgi:hypothetical protein|nr:hypothetical protein [Clostridiales Family XIII bacterium]